eukprot:8392756-Alexandrium_andersonii.AAC.1
MGHYGWEELQARRPPRLLSATCSLPRIAIDSQHRCSWPKRLSCDPVIPQPDHNSSPEALRRLSGGSPEP